MAIHLHADPFPQDRVEEFDVAFMVVNEGFDASIVARPLAQTEYVVCASPAYLKRMGTPKTPHELSQHHYLRFPWQASSGHAARGMRLLRLDGSQGEMEVAMQVVFQAESYETLFAAAVAGAGIAALPRFPASNYFESGALTHVLPEWIFGRYTVFVALPTRKLMPARTRAFVDFASDRVLKPAGSVS